MQSTSQPSRYRIVVRGSLGTSLAAAFQELDIDTSEGQTSLAGTFADQAQLHGLLDRLRDLGIAMVSVNAID